MDTPNPHRKYTLGDGVVRGANRSPYVRNRDDPLHRQLRIYTVDPSVPKLEGAVAVISIPYEPLAPGPVGRLVCVHDYDEECDVRYRPADLDDRRVLIGNGYEPSQSDPRFHQQMVYAVASSVSATFRRALGRQITWRPGCDQLMLRPHAAKMRNAYYDESVGVIDFGYFPASENAPGMLPGGFVFTCLSHDIIAHEVTHAVLDGLRAEFRHPSGPDVVAFHEAFADLVAIFQRFSYRDVVMNAIGRTRGKIEQGGYLTSLAQQFGAASGRCSALRSALGINQETGQPEQYNEHFPPHRLGSVLVAAVFEAFVKIYRRKMERYFRLASNGTGKLPPGEIPHDLQIVLVDGVTKLASEFLSICIRAIDYCPPVGLTFGDYLSALITADVDLVPDDPWDYRGAIIESFRKRNIYPRHAANLTVDSLLWRGSRIDLPAIEELSFANLRFRGDPGCVADDNELRRQADVLGEFITQPAHMTEFGLVFPNDPQLEGDEVLPPRIESVRSARRIGPDGQIVFDLVAEVTQSRKVRPHAGSPGFIYHGGSTIIFDPDGQVRYIVLKSLVGYERLKRRKEFLNGPVGQRFWELSGNVYRQRRNLFNLLHLESEGETCS